MHIIGVGLSKPRNDIVATPCYFLWGVQLPQPTIIASPEHLSKWANHHPMRPLHKSVHVWHVILRKYHITTWKCITKNTIKNTSSVSCAIRQIIYHIVRNNIKTCHSLILNNNNNNNNNNKTVLSLGDVLITKNKK